MIVKRFSGKSAEEALALAKWELGDDAIILSSGKAKDRWWKIWETGFQVLVATDFPHNNPSSRVAPAPQEAASLVESPVVEFPSPSPGPPDSRLDDVLSLLEGLNHRMERLEGLPDDATSARYEWLLNRGMSEVWARKLAEEASRVGEETGREGTQAIEAALLERLAPPSPISLAEPQVVLFVGPTGSGKTTTIAKLAAYCRLERQKSVLLISTDTFRVAAAEQLKTYSEIIGVPFRVALRPQDIAPILKEHPWDVVLIDTAGHSLNHAMYMAEIRTLAELSHATAIQLVLPATMASDLMVETALKFGDGLSPRICFTKLDEVHYSGALMSTVLTLGWPVSYLTDGQNVPDDIQVAFPETLWGWLKGRDDSDG